MNTIAFVAGVNNYSEYRVLPSAQRDAEDIASLFDSLEYKVYRSIDDEHDIAKQKFDEFLDDLLNNDYEAAIFYFAGHGTQVIMDDCLMFKDAPSERGISGSNLKNKSFVLDDIIKDMRIKMDDHVDILILDCCRDGRGTSLNSDISLKEIPFQTFLAFATTAGDTALSHVATNHGYFTESFLSQFDENDNIESIFKRVRADVYDKCGKLSWVHTCLVNDVFLNRGKESKYLCKPYSHDAYHDIEFHSSNLELDAAIKEMKILNYYHQRDAITDFKANVENATIDDKFVYGRNLWQSLVGGCFAAGNELLPVSIRKYNDGNVNHVLNGALYEMYFDKHDNPRHNIKGLRFANVLTRLMTEAAFENSKEFIKEALDETEVKFRFRIDNPQTVPVILNLKDAFEENAIGEKIYCVQNIIANGNDIKEEVFKDRKPVSKIFLKDNFQSILQVPKEYIRISGTRCEDNAILVKKE